MRKVYSIAFFVSVALTLATVIVLAVFGLRLGVDFRGGSVWEVSFANGRPAIADVQSVLSRPGVSGKEFAATAAGEQGVIIRSDELTEAEHQTLLAAFGKAFPAAGVSEQKFDSVGPVVGSALKQKSITAVALVLAGIVAYIAIVFRSMRRVLSPWVMGLAAVIALAHDVLVPLGVFAVLGRTAGIEITAVFVAAVLTILGYSISDTVVVFDRVRENILRPAGNQSFAEVVHVSIMQTLVRSINTSATTLLSLSAIYLFGGESVKYFALALIIGVASGTYSSMFIASPILVWWSGRRGLPAASRRG